MNSAANEYTECSTVTCRGITTPDTLLKLLETFIDEHNRHDLMVHVVQEKQSASGQETLPTIEVRHKNADTKMVWIVNRQGTGEVVSVLSADDRGEMPPTALIVGSDQQALQDFYDAFAEVLKENWLAFDWYDCT
jgi:hypothetical protein